MQEVYVLGYSMGARMTTAFLAAHEQPAVAGYIGIGVLQDGGELLDANLNIRKLKVPVLDVYADVTPLDLKSAENRKALAGPQFEQVHRAGANHSSRGHEAELSQRIPAWLKAR